MGETVSPATGGLSQIGAFDLDVLLALAAVFLGLSLAVQVIQELYKFVTTSKARAYRKALIDFVGEKIDVSRKDRTLGGMLLRGPFQWLARQRPVHLLPSDSGELVQAVERTAHPAVQEALQHVRDEQARQGGVPRSPSPALRHWFDELCKTAQKDPCAQEVVTHLEQLGVAARADAQAPGGEAISLSGGSFDAASVLDSLQECFVKEARTAEREFEQFATNFDYAYRRRNVRQTLVIGFLLAILLNLPINALYRQARSLSPEQVSQLAESALKLEESIRARDAAASEDAGTSAEGGGVEATEGETGGGDGSDDTAGEDAAGSAGGTDGDPGENMDALLGHLDDAVRMTLTLETEARVFRPIWHREEGQTTIGAVWAGLKAAARISNLLACLATAVLIAFGAPFWHRFSKALLAVRKPTSLVVGGTGGSDGGR